MHILQNSIKFVHFTAVFIRTIKYIHVYAACVGFLLANSRPGKEPITRRAMLAEVLLVKVCLHHYGSHNFHFYTAA